MSILVNYNTKIICQGFTGRQGTFHSKQSIDYGTNMVGGVTPGKGGTIHLGRPVFNTVDEAVQKTHANTSIIYVPASKCFDAVLESIDAGIKLIVCITEGIPIIDMVKIKNILKNKNDVFMIGPNCPGIISPKLFCKLGIMPSYIYKPGNIGIVSRSGTLTYEITKIITDHGFGQSTCVGIGGDPILGSNFIDILKLFNKDKETKIIIMIGEIGGNMEEQAAIYIKNFKKPIISYISGITAPTGKRMGHAGAIINGGQGTAQKKIDILKKSGVLIAYKIIDILKLIKKVNN